MTASAFMPDVVVEIAFDSGYATPAASRTWTDVSAYVEAQFGIHIQRGRSDELSDVEPSQLTLTLDNKDGRFTAGYAAGANYPNVKIGRPIRVSATWVLGGGGTTYRRFTGYVDEWPVEWPDGSQAMAHATVTASSRMARLGRTEAFLNVVSQDVAVDDPAVYYTLGDPAGSTSASNSSAFAYAAQAVVTQVGGTGGTATFGTATGPGTDGLTALDLSPGGGIDNGKYLRADMAAQLTSDATGHLSLECWFVTSGDGTAVSLGRAGTYLSISVASGLLAAHHFNGTDFYYALSGATVTDGLLHHAVVKVSPNGANFRTQLMLDGAVVANVTTQLVAGALDEFGAAGRSLHIGKQHAGSSNGFLLFDGTVAHVAVYNTDVGTTRFAEHYDSGSTGFVGDSSDARIDRLAAMARIPTAEVSTETGDSTSLEFQDTAGKAPVQAMLDVVHTENGLLFDAGDGTLVFQARGHRYDEASTLTLDVTTQQVEADLQPKLDDQGMLNDATLSNSAGSVRATDQASIDDHGVYAQQATLLTSSALELADAANYKIAVYSQPQVRVPGAVVQVVAQPSATITAILAVELGSKITLANLPTQAPASSMDFYVEGYTELIGFESWTWQANLSPEFDLSNVWTVQDAVYGQYDAYGLAY